MCGSLSGGTATPGPGSASLPLPPPLGMYGLPRPWYFPLQKSYWLGSGRTETWEWSWPWARAPRLSVMEEDQACAMESRRLGEAGAGWWLGQSLGFGGPRAALADPPPWCRGAAGHGGGAHPPAARGLCGQAHQGLQERQEVGSGQAESEPLREPGGVLPGTQRGRQDNDHVGVRAQP